MSDSRPASTLAMDADLRSMPDGSAQIHWGPATLWPLSRGARAVRAYLALLDSNDETNTKVTLVGEAGVDGRSWQPLSENLLGSQAGRSAISDRGVYDNIYLGRRELDFPLLVRFGIKVENSASAEGRVRVTAIVEPIDGPVTSTFAVGVDPANPTEPVDLDDDQVKTLVGSPFAVSGAKTVTVLVDVVDLQAPGTKSLKVHLETRVNRSSGAWALAGETATTITATGAYIFTCSDDLGAEARISYTTVDTTGEAWFEVVIRDF